MYYSSCTLYIYARKSIDWFVLVRLHFLKFCHTFDANERRRVKNIREKISIMWPVSWYVRSEGTHYVRIERFKMIKVHSHKWNGVPPRQERKERKKKRTVKDNRTEKRSWICRITFPPSVAFSTRERRADAPIGGVTFDMFFRGPRYTRSTKKKLLLYPKMFLKNIFGASSPLY